MKKEKHYVYCAILIDQGVEDRVFILYVKVVKSKLDIWIFIAN